MKKKITVVLMLLVVLAFAAPIVTYAADSKTSTSSTKKSSKKKKKKDGFTKSMEAKLKPIKKYALEDEDIGCKKVIVETYKKTKTMLITRVTFSWGGQVEMRTEIRTKKKKNGKYSSTWWLNKGGDWDVFTKSSVAEIKEFLEM